MNEKKQCVVVVLLLLLSWACGPFGTPPMGKINGQVIDSSDGSFIPGANISTDPPTSSVTTDAQGEYSIADMPPGDYTVTASKAGYNSTSVDVAVAVGKTTTADLHLTPVSPDTPSGLGTKSTLADGLVAYYPFDGNANDESGNGNHGIVFGALLAGDRFGNPESAYCFDGVDDRVDVESNSHLDFGTAGFSISGWFKTNYVHTDSNGKSLLDKYPQRGKPWTIRLHTDGTLRFLCDESVYSNVPVNDDLWHHFVALRSESTIKLFIDGELQGTASSTSSATNLRPLCFGCVHWPSGGISRFFKGTLDDVRIYNRALSDVEIQSLHRQDQAE